MCVRQHTQDIRGCPCVSVCVCQHTQDIRGCPSVHISARWSLTSARWPVPWTVWVILAHVGCLLGTHRTSVVVRQHTQDVGQPQTSEAVRQHTHYVRVCPAAHTRRLWLSVCGRLWLSISTLVLGLSTLALPVDCLGDFGPRGLSVQYTQDVRGCPPAHTGRPWLSVCIRVCQCVSVSTDRTSVGVRQHTQDVHVCPPAHTGRLWLSVAVRQHT